MVSLEQAFATLIQAAGPLGTERVPVVRAAGRVAAVDVTAPGPVPAAPRVMMDGYACRAADLAEAGPGRPVRLRLTGRRWAGSAREAADAAAAGGTGGVGPREAWQVSTGALLPPGADVVVPTERARRVRDAAGEWVEVAVPLPVGRHVAPPGEDVLAGQRLVAAGDRITPRRAGLLAAAGIGWVTVWRRPRVLLLATGDELVPAGRGSPGTDPAAVPNSNALTLAAAIASLGLEVEAGGIVPDEPAALAAVLRRAAASGADVVITTGGVSVGPRDRVARTWLDLGARRLLGRIDVKPGGPFFAGRLGPVWVLGLPGSPASCLAAFEVLVRPFLLRLAGQRAIVRPAVRARLAAPWPKAGDRPRLIWARLDRAGGAVEPLVPSMGRLEAVARSDALLYHPGRGAPPRPGEAVWALDLEASEDRAWPDWFAPPAVPAGWAREGAAVPRSRAMGGGGPDRPGGDGGPDPGEAARSQPGGTAGPGTAGPGEERLGQPGAGAQPGPADAGRPPALRTGAPRPGPPVVAVTGRSGSGKTQAAAGLIAQLARQGVRVLAVKHAAHGFDLDRRGSDSQRLAEAGAVAVALIGPEESALRLLRPAGDADGGWGPDPAEPVPARVRPAGAGPPPPANTGSARDGGTAGDDGEAAEGMAHPRAGAARPPASGLNPAVPAPGCPHPGDAGASQPGAPGSGAGTGGIAWTGWVDRLVDACQHLLGARPDLVLVEGGAGAGWPEVVVGEAKVPPRGEVVARLRPGFGPRELEAAAAALARWLAAGSGGGGGSRGAEPFREGPRGGCGEGGADRAPRPTAPAPKP